MPLLRCQSAVVSGVAAWLLVSIPHAQTHVGAYDGAVDSQPAERPQLLVKPTGDFEITGNGAHTSWQQTEWTPLRRRQADGLPYDTRFKVLYSNTGLYLLMDGTDRKLTATMSEDFMDLWHEDVFEAFFWTDERHPLYFEYEISPLNHELALMVPNFGGHYLGWRPWHYERNRVTRKATAIGGGRREPHASIQGWQAEVFFPYALLDPLQNVPPRPGTRWRANFYRMDYDAGAQPTQWEWARVGPSFHEYEKFGELVFAER
jgi:hypothetical protein